LNTIKSNIKDILMMLKIGGEDSIPTNKVMNEFKRRGIEISLSELQTLFPRGNGFIAQIDNSTVMFDRDVNTMDVDFTPPPEEIVHDMAAKAAKNRR
jgi:hypothetical protein